MNELLTSTAFVVLLAIALDRVLGEPRRLHPLVAFGRLAAALERQLNRGSAVAQLLLGALAYGLAVLPALVVLLCLSAMLAEQSLWLSRLLDVLVLYLAIGWQSMREHVLPIVDALAAGDLDTARRALSYIVSRDTASLDESQLLTAAVETTLENSSDALLASLFWFAVAGPVAVLAHRLSNTLDAMWGYRNTRFNYFGRVAARSDDLLNFIPAQLTALSFALLRASPRALRCLMTQGWRWKSVNAGAVMASGAAALGLKLGGEACYHGQHQRRATLGEGRSPRSADLARALHLVDGVSLLWLLLLFVMAVL